MRKSGEQSWAMEEFLGINLGDERLNQRLIKLFESFSESPESPINQACANWAETKAAYRFFKNDNVDSQEIMETHSEMTAQRASKYQTILAIQDTSYLIYTHHPETTGLGKISLGKGRNVEKIYSHGLVMHSCLAVTTEGLPLGLLDQRIFARENLSEKTKRERDTTPIQEKESYRWIESLYNSTMQLKGTQVVTVCDREADIYELFQQSTELGASILVRANHDRTVNKRSMYQEGEIDTLWQLLAKELPAGAIKVEVPERKGTKHALPREARVATVELKFCPYKLNPPKRLSSELSDIDMYAVYVSEKHPPENIEPIEWMLITNLKVSNFDQAYEKVQWYCLRWRIEMLHKVLKSGFQVEECRLSTAERLIRYLTIMSIVACRLFMITLLARTDPELPCTVLLSDTEWKVLYLKTHNTTSMPNNPPNVRDVVVWIARLGGFLARKGDGNPGSITLWRGWKRLTDLVDGYSLAQIWNICG